MRYVLAALLAAWKNRHHPVVARGFGGMARPSTWRVRR